MNFVLFLSLHIFSPELNNIHPIVQFNDNSMAYINSFEKPAIAVFKTESSENFKFRYGITTGYERTMVYKNKVYGNFFALENGPALFLVPSYEKDNFIAALMGEAVCFGYKL